ncbi:tRNA-modifying protein ygfZ [Candidatus Photodesmus katoptron]|uniref:tRNA-modifying protein YgfZ n=1 Tax=Candidatus Photodesmus katoptron Akat1 TaxID=1236703 RepID=S3EGN6_9GAMM|nr:tRNA-modifying protein YgfZ [Candidatus Photodesmus katoptron]EPE37313.1 tRNA-modifying protein YgfZ [Candidatus Photodesmus katoptron Akat1]KEY90016.1 tRNA-modifying protein ygfZ [Candidatus Photodesmus katoptron]
MDWYNSFTPLSLKTETNLPSLIISYLSSWGCITITGREKESYLQGQLTCDVIKLTKNESTLGAYCNAKGKVWSIFRLFHHKKGYAMFQHISSIPKTLTEMQKYAVFSKVRIEQSKEVLFGIIGNQATNFIDCISDDYTNVRSIKNGTAIKIDDKRWLLLVDKASAKVLLTNTDAIVTDGTIWTRFDIESGLPIIKKGQQNTYIPQSVNLDLLNGISFTKGCYTGQETIARSKYRGNNKKTMYILKGTVEKPIETEKCILLDRAIGKNWRKAGQLLESYQFENSYGIGLLVAPKDLSINTKFRLTSQPNQFWYIQPLPYYPDKKQETT